jgi:type IV fimbrial biogenesis protein FimT
MNYPHDAIRHKSSTAIQGRRQCRGFSLVEIMAVLTIASILMAGAVPALNSVGAMMKLSSFSNDFLSQLHLARSEAIKRNSRVVICKSADGTSCSASGGWEQGSIVFHDANNDGLRDVEAEHLILRADALPDDYRFAGNQNVGRYISFNAQGRAQLVSGGFQAGTLTLCSRSAEWVAARQVVISAVGRPRIHKTTVALCT